MRIRDGNNSDSGWKKVRSGIQDLGYASRILNTACKQNFKTITGIACKQMGSMALRIPVRNNLFLVSIWLWI
jgi:hypothetical protein